MHLPNNTGSIRFRDSEMAGSVDFIGLATDRGQYYDSEKKNIVDILIKRGG